MGFRASFLLTSITVWVSTEASACPFCHSDIAKLVRTGLWQSLGDGTHALAVALPFIGVLAALQAWDSWRPL